ncbi:hypothetical protein IW262DRAFT_1468588 [Armillaria fumosa]|nr:hypothetical protein IW262DRAFT_1468588 [Armillaria fumosa]
MPTSLAAQLLEMALAQLSIGPTTPASSKVVDTKLATLPCAFQSPTPVKETILPLPDLLMASIIVSKTPSMGLSKELFLSDPDSPLHCQPSTGYKIRHLLHNACQLAKNTPSKLQVMNAMSCPLVFPDPDPILQDESESKLPQEVAKEGPILEGSTITAILDDQAAEIPEVPMKPFDFDDLMDFDDDQPPSPSDDEYMSLKMTLECPKSVEASSPLPHRVYRSCHNKFNNPVGDIDYTLLPAIATRPSIKEASLEDIQHSHCECQPPPPLNALENPKLATENPIKKQLWNNTKKHCSHPDSNDTVKEPILKRQKTLGLPVENDEVLPTPAMQKHGPGLIKPPPASIGIGGNEFGEEISLLFRVIVRIVPIDERIRMHAEESVECVGLAKLLATSPLGRSPKIDYGWKSHPDLDNAFQVLKEWVVEIAFKTCQFMAGLDILDNAQAIHLQMSQLCASLATSAVPV